MTSAVENSTTTGTYETSQHHRSENERSARDVFYDYLHQFRNYGQLSEIDGGDGDDEINSEASHAHIHGGAGDDTINASGWNIKVEGGTGDDVINVEGSGVLYAPVLHLHHAALIHSVEYHRDLEAAGQDGHGHSHCHHHSIPVCGFLMPVLASRAYGGEGNDTINAQGFSYVRGEEGDDTINMMGGRGSGGDGDDVMNHHGGSVQMFGGEGDDTIFSSGSHNINSMLWGGAGNDTIEASGTHLNIHGGTGDDKVVLDGTDDRGVASLFGTHNPHINSMLTGGLGDDAFELINDAAADFNYYVGDGHDTIRGAGEESLIRLGAGITSENTSFDFSDDDLVMSFVDFDGSITIKDYASMGVPSLQFGDGRMLDASTMIAYASGEPAATGENVSTDEAEAKSTDQEDHDD